MELLNNRIHSTGSTKAVCPCVLVPAVARHTLRQNVITYSLHLWPCPIQNLLLVFLCDKSIIATYESEFPRYFMLRLLTTPLLLIFPRKKKIKTSCTLIYLGEFLNFVKDECWNNMKYEDLESMPL